MVAEVASRFEDTRAFLNAMAQLGFKSVSKVRTQVCPVLRPREPGSPEKELTVLAARAAQGGTAQPDAGGGQGQGW